MSGDEGMASRGCAGACSWGNCYDGSPSRWRVKCDCGFLVENLTSAEAAEDTYRWHKGQRSHLEDATGVAWSRAIAHPLPPPSPEGDD